MKALVLLNATVERFFRWWFGELAGLLPKGWASSRRPRLVVTLAAGEAVFYHGRGPDLRELGSVSLSQGDDSARRDLVSRLIAPVRLRVREVVLRLPRKRALRRQVELPLAAGENLREVLGFEMDRHTPFKADEVYFDYRRLSADSVAKRLVVDLAVVTRTVADQEMARLHGWGIAPDRLEIEDDVEGDGAGFNLLPTPALEAAAGGQRRFTVLTATAACVLLAMVLYLPLHQKQGLLGAAEARLAATRAEAAEANALREQVERILGRGRFVVEQKRGKSSVAELLDEVTRLLPDDTWVIQLSWSGDRLTLAGYSPKPSALIALLEESDMLSAVRFNSPVTVDQRIGVERFNLSATVVRKEGS